MGAHHTALSPEGQGEEEEAGEEEQKSTPDPAFEEGGAPPPGRGGVSPGGDIRATETRAQKEGHGKLPGKDDQQIGLACREAGRVHKKRTKVGLNA